MGWLAACLARQEMRLRLQLPAENLKYLLYSNLFKGLLSGIHTYFQSPILEIESIYYKYCRCMLQRVSISELTLNLG